MTVSAMSAPAAFGSVASIVRLSVPRHQCMVETGTLDVEDGLAFREGDAVLKTPHNPTHDNAFAQHGGAVAMIRSAIVKELFS